MPAGRGSPSELNSCFGPKYGTNKLGERSITNLLARLLLKVYTAPREEDISTLYAYVSRPPTKDLRSRLRWYLSRRDAARAPGPEGASTVFDWSTAIHVFLKEEADGA